MAADTQFEIEQIILRRFGNVPKRARGYARLLGKSRLVKGGEVSRLTQLVEPDGADRAEADRPQQDRHEPRRRPSR